MNRHDVGILTDFELQLTASLVKSKLARAWERLQPGKVEDVYDLALLTSEAVLRGISLGRYANPAQLRLFSGSDDAPWEPHEAPDHQ